MSRWRNTSGLLKMGWIGILIAMSAVAALYLPLSAWLRRSDAAFFNVQVGWANILAFVVGAITLTLIAFDKLNALVDVSKGRLDKISDQLARNVRKQEARRLAALLGTDEFDSRSASFRFKVVQHANSQRIKMNSNKFDTLENVAEFYGSSTTGRMLVLGEPGVGKTVLALRLVVDLLDRRLELADSNGWDNSATPIPIVFDLPLWDPFSLSLDKWLATQITEIHGLAAKLSSRLLSEGYLVPVLDGLDEMGDPRNDGGRTSEAVRLLNERAALDARSPIVVLCRSGSRYYDGIGRRLRNFDAIEIQPLSPSEIENYIRMQCPAAHDLEEWSPVFRALKGPKSKHMRGVLGTPWRLTTAVTYFLYGGQPMRLLPTVEESTGSPGTGRKGETRSKYELRVDMLLLDTYIEARTKLHRVRGITFVDSKRWLISIASLLSSARDQGKQGSEILPHEWWQVLDSAKTVRAHLWLIFFVIHLPAISFNFIDVESQRAPDSGPDWSTLAVFASNYLFVAFMSFQRAASAPTLRHLSLSQARTARGALLLATGGSLAVAIAVLGASISDDSYAAVLSASMFLLLFLMVASTGFGVEGAQMTPSRRLRADLVYNFLLASAWAFFAGFYYGQMIGSAFGIFFALLFFGGWLSSSSYFRYLVSAYRGFTHFQLPLRLVRYLDWASVAGILKVSGSGYQFRHQQLQAHLERLASQKIV